MSAWSHGVGHCRLCLDAGYNVIGIDRTAEAAEAGHARISGIIARNRASGRIDEAGETARLSRLVTGDDMARLTGADLVIEAVFDDVEVKTALIASSTGRCGPTPIIATNTSYLDPDRLQRKAAIRPPARAAFLLARQHHAASRSRPLQGDRQGCAGDRPAVARRLGKLAIVTGVTEGFIGNSVFSAYRHEAEFMLEDGPCRTRSMPPWRASALSDGLFAVNDMAGLDIAWARRKRQAASRDPAERYVAIADRLCERAGSARRPAAASISGATASASRIRTSPPSSRRSGRGRRLCRDPFRRGDHEAPARRHGGRGPDPPHKRRCGATLHIDLVMINGYGFPAWRGGPMYLAGL